MIKRWLSSKTLNMLNVDFCSSIWGLAMMDPHAGLGPQADTELGMRSPRECALGSPESPLHAWVWPNKDITTCD